jgi:hypothetical protein
MKKYLHVRPDSGRLGRGVKGEILNSRQTRGKHVGSSTRLHTRTPTDQYFRRIGLLTQKKKAESLGMYRQVARDSKEASAPMIQIQIQNPDPETRM